MVSITYINGDVQVSDTVSPRTLCAKYDSKSCNMNHSAHVCIFIYMYIYIHVHVHVCGLLFCFDLLTCLRGR